MRCVFAILLATAAACGGGDDGFDPDGGGDGDGDGGLSAGISVRLVAVPEIPGSFNSDFEPSTVNELIIRLSNIRVVGDATPDAIDSRDLDFGDDAETINFENAPPFAQYQRIRAQIDEVEASGTLDDGETQDWEIDDRPPSGLALDLTINVDLGPGEVAVVEIEVDFAQVFAAIDWSTVEEEDGALKVDEEFSGIDEVRQKFVEMFQVTGDGSGANGGD